MRNRFRCIVCVGVAAVLLSPLGLRPATAQERPGSWYLMGGVALESQNGESGESFQTYVAAPAGLSLGWWVAGGRFTSSRVSAEGEMAATGIMRARQQSRYGYTYNLERQDIYLGFNIRLHAGRAGDVHIEPVVGAGIVLHRSWSQADWNTNWPAPGGAVEHGPRSQNSTLDNLYLSGGVDFRVGGRHVAFVPSFRVRLNDSTKGLQSRWPGGYPHVTFSGGGSVRIDF